MGNVKNSKRWYLIAYDIRDPKRLQKVHRHLKRRAVALQKSVFLIHGHRQDVAALRDALRGLADGREDDIRLYPISSPDRLWMSGRQAGDLSVLYPGNATGTRKRVRTRITRGLQRIFGGLRQ